MTAAVHRARLGRSSAATSLLLALAGILSTRRQRDADDYFLAGHRVPIWLVAVSVLSTTQSAATFLGAPDYGYRGDYTYLTSYLGPLIAAFLVARFLIPRFYAEGVTTVYELLGNRFDARAMRAAGGMYLIGRIFASGARLYLAAIAVSMIIFADIQPSNVLAASAVLVVLGLVFTFIGGLRSVIWSDLVQVVLYVGAALAVLCFLWTQHSRLDRRDRPRPHDTPDGDNKLRLIDLSLDLTAPFSLLATVTGITLLFFASMGLDQDITQRFLACRDAREGKRALYASVLASIPVVLLFLAIGSLLYVFYDRPDLMGGAARRRRGGRVRGREDHHLHALYPDPDPARRARLRRGRRARRGGGQFRADLDVLGADPGFLPALDRAAPRDARGAFRPRRPRRHGPARARLAGDVGALLLLAALHRGAFARFRLVGDDLRLFRPARRLFHLAVHPPRLHRLGDLRRSPPASSRSRSSRTMSSTCSACPPRGSRWPSPTSSASAPRSPSRPACWAISARRATSCDRAPQSACAAGDRGSIVITSGAMYSSSGNSGGTDRLELLQLRGTDVDNSLPKTPVLSAASATKWRVS